MDRLVVPSLFVLVPLAALGGACLRARHPGARAPYRITGWAVLALFGGFLALMVVGETLADLGPSVGLALLLPWTFAAVVAVVLAAVAPRAALRTLAAVAVVPVALAAWEAVAPAAAQAWTDRVGPLELVLTYAVAGVAAVAARTAPRFAGGLTTVVAGLPMALRLATPAGDPASSVFIATLSAPALGAGVAFLLAARRRARGQPPGSSSGPAPAVPRTG